VKRIDDQNMSNTRMQLMNCENVNSLNGDLDSVFERPVKKDRLEIKEDLEKWKAMKKEEEARKKEE
jgi:hypothetical protein